MKSYLFAALSLSSATAVAASQSVVLETPITYAPGAEVVERVKTECHIEDMLANHVGEVLRKPQGRSNQASIPMAPKSSNSRFLTYLALVAARGQARRPSP